jgi:hypothetical protein
MFMFAFAPEFILLFAVPVWALAAPAKASAAVATAAMSKFRMKTSFGKLPMPAKRPLSRDVPDSAENKFVE